MEHTSTFWLKFGSLSPAVTLKSRSRSTKPNQLFTMSQCYIHANLVEICQPVHETLKIKSRSPKPNELFIMSQSYIHANLVKIHPPDHEISCKQESVTVTPTPTPTPTLTPTPTGSAPKIIAPPPLQWGT